MFQSPSSLGPGKLDTWFITLTIVFVGEFNMGSYEFMLAAGNQLFPSFVLERVQVCPSSVIRLEERAVHTAKLSIACPTRFINSYLIP